MSSGPTREINLADIVLYLLIVLQCVSILVLFKVFRNPEHKLLRDVLLGFLYVTGIPVVGGLCLFVDRRRAERKKRLHKK